MTLLLAQVRRIEAAGGQIQGGRLVSGLQVDEVTGDITAVLSRDTDGNTTVHPADALVFAIGITGPSLYLPYKHIPVWHPAEISAC